MVEKNTSESQNAVIGLVHAIRQCIEANTRFAQSAETLLSGALSSSGGTGTSSRSRKRERLSVRELAEILPLSPGTIRRLATAKKIPSSWLGKKLVFDLQAVLAAMDRPSAATQKRARQRGEAQLPENDKDATL